MYFTRLHLSQTLLIALIAVDVCLISPDLLAKGTVSKELVGIAKIFDQISDLITGNLARALMLACVVIGSVISGFGPAGLKGFASVCSIAVALVFALSWVKGAYTLVLP